MSEQDLGSRPILYEAFPRGLCAGVIKAVTESEDYIAQKRAGDPSARIFYVGFPAHNTHINNRFRDNGVTFVTDVSEAESGGSVIFGPHGSTDKDIEIDLSEVDYIDSSGVGVLISLLKLQKKKEKELIIEKVSSKVLNVLKLSSLSDVFNL